VAFGHLLTPGHLLQMHWDPVHWDPAILADGRLVLKGSDGRNPCLTDERTDVRTEIRFIRHAQSHLRGAHLAVALLLGGAPVRPGALHDGALLVVVGLLFGHLAEEDDEEASEALALRRPRPAAA
jgi:hypothetical protein